MRDFTSEFRSVFSKAQADAKAQSRRRRDEQYILRKLATPPLGIRFIFEKSANNALKSRANFYQCEMRILNRRIYDCFAGS